MPVPTFTQPDFTSQEPTAYKAALDAAVAVLARTAAAFAPHEQAVPDLTVRLDAGFIPAQGALATEIAAQSTAAITAPVTDPRRDIVYIDAATGAVGVATGTEDAAPSDPAVPAGKVAIARVRLTVAMSEIGNADLDDLRNLSVLGLGSAAFEVATAFESAGAAAALAATLGDLATADDAGDVPYDNAASGLLASNVKAAIDEIAASAIDQQTFYASDPWNKPVGGSFALIECWGGGGSGARNTSNVGGPGGGAAYAALFVPLAALASSEPVTIGAGGLSKTVNAVGDPGGTTTFGSWLAAYGGGGGGNNRGAGGGGGAFEAGSDASGNTGGAGGGPGGGAANSDAEGLGGGGGGGGGGFDGGSAFNGGAGGACSATTGTAQAAGESVMGGGGGGGGASTGTPTAGGASSGGGDGGAGASGTDDATDGEQPGGGGGGSYSGNSGAGGDGMCRVTVW